MKIPRGSSSETFKLILKLIWRFEGPRIAEAFLKKKVGGLALLDFRTSDRAIIMKAVMT